MRVSGSILLTVLAVLAPAGLLAQAAIPFTDTEAAPGREIYRMQVQPRASKSFLTLASDQAPFEGYGVGITQRRSTLIMMNTNFVTSELSNPATGEFEYELETIAAFRAGVDIENITYYVEFGGDYDVVLTIVNDNFVPASVEFVLNKADGESEEASRTILSTNQLSLNVSELFVDDEGAGVLAIESSQPVFIQGQFEVDNGKGRTILAPAPVVFENQAATEEMASRRILPYVKAGAGSFLRLILINTEQETSTGLLEITGQEATPYSIEPGQSFVLNIPPDARAPLEGKAVVRAISGSAPHAFAIVAELTRDNSISSMFTVNSYQEGTLFWAPVNTKASARHRGDIDATLYAVNELDEAATLYMVWFDGEGNSVGSYDHMINRGERVVLDLEEVFGQSPVQGILRLFADPGVSLTLLESTRTIMGRRVVMDIPLLTVPEGSKTRFIFPLFRQGQGAATEFLTINTDRSVQEGSMRVLQPNGSPIATNLE